MPDVDMQAQFHLQSPSRLIDSKAKDAKISATSIWMENHIFTKLANHNKSP